MSLRSRRLILIVRQCVLIHSYVEILTSTIHNYFRSAKGNYEKIAKIHTVETLVEMHIKIELPSNEYFYSYIENDSCLYERTVSIHVISQVEAFGEIRRRQIRHQ
jgi:hypothetical protein